MAFWTPPIQIPAPVGQGGVLSVHELRRDHHNIHAGVCVQIGLQIPSAHLLVGKGDVGIVPVKVICHLIQSLEIPEKATVSN